MAFATLTINIDIIKQNIEDIKSTTQCKVLLVAKANAYGLGATSICQKIDTIVDYFGVATIDEATELRKHNIQAPILLLSEPLPHQFHLLTQYDITTTLYQADTIQALQTFATTHQTPIKTQFKIDTGMTRLGANWQTSQPVLTQWQNSSNVLIKEGIYSHLANSDQPNHPLNTTQLDRFQTIVTPFQNLTKHCSNSHAIHHFKDSHHDMVRVGIDAYHNAFTLTAPIRNIHTVSQNTSVGYGSTYITSKNCQIATLGIGYADGIPSSLSNQGHVMIQNTKCAIVGSICMDMIMVEIPSELSISANDTATILSNGTDKALTIFDMATLSGLNPREIMTHFSDRIHRTISTLSF
jgi:alanine racemase